MRELLLSAATLLLTTTAIAQSQLDLRVAGQAITARVPIASGNCAADLEKPFTVSYRLSGQVAPDELAQHYLTGMWEPVQNTWRGKLASVRAEEAALASLSDFAAEVRQEAGAAARRWRPILLSFDIPERTSSLVLNGTLRTGGMEWSTVVRLNFIILSGECVDRLVDAMETLPTVALPEGFKRIETYVPVRAERDSRPDYVRPDGATVRACLDQLERKVKASYWVDELQPIVLWDESAEYFRGRPEFLAAEAIKPQVARLRSDLNAIPGSDLVIVPLTFQVREQLLGDRYVNARRNARLGMRVLAVAEVELVIVNGACSRLLTQVRDRLEELRSRTSGLDLGGLDSGATTPRRPSAQVAVEWIPNP